MERFYELALALSKFAIPDGDQKRKINGVWACYFFRS